MGMTNLSVIAQHSNLTNERLGMVLSPANAVTYLRPGDIALGRIDVRSTLDGVEAGLWALDALEERGVKVLNRRTTLTHAHDKLLTARALRLVGLPHPLTVAVGLYEPPPLLEAPVVLKPRFGSWGRDVVRCDTPDELTDALTTARTLPWFGRAGGIVQELVPPQGFDLRILVARGRVVGAAKRLAPPGEWRTNVALGARRSPARPSLEASEIAIAAASAIGGDLVGVDLLPTEKGWTIIEINGAVDFTNAYSLDGSDVYSTIRDTLTGRTTGTARHVSALRQPVARAI